MTLKSRLDKIERLERELISKSAQVLKSGASMFLIDLYLIGAVNRTLSQSKGFRAMIEGRNFPCATVLLRTQIDTAMRINGIRFLADPTESLGEIISGSKTFDKLKSASGVRFTDKYLREELTKEYSWISNVYKETSDFVHLSFRHLSTSISSTDDETGTLNFAISGEDTERSDDQYFEVCEAFFEASKIASTLILEVFLAVHEEAE